MEGAETPGKILIVEDDEGARIVVERAMRNDGHNVVSVGTGQEALNHFGRFDTEVVLLDLGLPDIGGLEVLPRLMQLDETAAVVVVSGMGDIETVVEAMKLGAEGFVVKPFEPANLCKTVRRALRKHRLARHAAVYEAAVASRTGTDAVGTTELVGSSPQMSKVRGLIMQVATTESSVVLMGESGTGKGVVARLIHRHSRRPHGPFVNLSCAALPANLVESEIFGHEPGAFTDAKVRKPGLLEVANGGTLFLDEVAEMEASSQSKLLKVIEERTFRRLGGVRDLSTDVRFVVATHADLLDLVRKGRFRRDLYYRLNVFQIEMPPLRERGEDILELAYQFVRTLNPALGRRVARISEPVARMLQRYPWPGNVRELHNVIERAMILCQGEQLLTAHMPKDLLYSRADGMIDVPTLDEVEAAHIERVLTVTGGNVKLAAKRLGISRSTLYEKMEKFGIKHGQAEDREADASRQARQR
ncbi:MAG: sigma-54 dependent transcriptional regulator [Acidobacteriota bacterium]